MVAEGNRLKPGLRAVWSPGFSRHAQTIKTLCITIAARPMARSGRPLPAFFDISILPRRNPRLRRCRHHTNAFGSASRSRKRAGQCAPPCLPNPDQPRLIGPVRAYSRLIAPEKQMAKASGRRTVDLASTLSSKSDGLSRDNSVGREVIATQIFAQGEE